MKTEITMTQVKAAQAWALLAWAARSRQILTYEDVGKLTGMATQGVGNTALGPIKRYCKTRGYPALTVIVVGKHSGVHGDGLDDAVSAANSPKEQMKVFAFDWMNAVAPNLEDLT